MTALKRLKLQNAAIIAHTANIVARTLRRTTETKTEDVLEEDQIGFRRGKGTREAIGMLRYYPLCLKHTRAAFPSGDTH